jgi:hypothetical protein
LHFEIKQPSPAPPHHALADDCRQEGWQRIGHQNRARLRQSGQYRRDQRIGMIGRLDHHGAFAGKAAGQQFQHRREQRRARPARFHTRPRQSGQDMRFVQARHRTRSIERARQQGRPAKGSVEDEMDRAGFGLHCRDTVERKPCLALRTARLAIGEKPRIAERRSFQFEELHPVSRPVDPVRDPARIASDFGGFEGGIAHIGLPSAAETARKGRLKATHPRSVVEQRRSEDLRPLSPVDQVYRGPNVRAE